MHVISNPQVNAAIKQFINKNVPYNRSFYQTVLTKDKQFMEQFLNRFYYTFEKLFYNKHTAASIFIRRLQLIDAVRLDKEDESVMPFKFAFDEMKDSHGKLEGGIFVPTKNYGVVIIDMDFVNKSKGEAIHTLIHELIHAMCLIMIRGSEGSEYKCGVNRNGRAFNRLNEGITEFIAQLMWKGMYPNHPCPGEDRYAVEVAAAKLVMEKYYSQDQFIEDYISSGVVLEREMKKIVNSNNVNLFKFICGFDDLDFIDEKVQEKFVQELKDFKLNIYVKS